MARRIGISWHDDCNLPFCGIEFAGTTCLAIATADNVASRRSRIVGGRDWVRLGAVEMGLDCLRRYLQGLLVNERIDFEKTE